MKLYMIFITIYLASITQLTSAQTIDISQFHNVEFARISTINRDGGNISNRLKTNVKMDMDRVSINKSGTAIRLRDKLVLNLKEAPQIVDLPKYDGFFPTVLFPSKGDNLVFVSPLSGNEFDLTLRFFNLSQQEVLRTFHFQSSLNTPVPDFVISRDGMIVAIENVNAQLDVYILEGEQYHKTVIGKPRWEMAFLMISESGNRLVYKTNTEGIMEWVYVDRITNGWSDEKPFTISPLNVDGVEVPLHIEGLANAGKTLVLKPQINDNKTGHNHLAVSHEIDGIWSELEYVGNFEFREMPLDGVDVYHSDDGQVIAVRQTKRALEDYGPQSYDAIVFAKNKYGEWVKNKVNPDGTEVKQDILLSGDGKQLIWIPSPSSSVDMLDLR